MFAHGVDTRRLRRDRAGAHVRSGRLLNAKVTAAPPTKANIPVHNGRIRQSFPEPARLDRFDPPPAHPQPSEVTVMTELSALALVCTLNPSPEASSSELMASHVLENLEKHGVRTSSVRVADHNIKPGIATDLGRGTTGPRCDSRCSTPTSWCWRRRSGWGIRAASLSGSWSA